MRDQHSTPRHVPVLIVGGSLSGLSAALFLAAEGVECLLVEQRPGTSVHPRARLVTARSMELFRSVGIEDAVREAGDPGPIGFVVVDTLADEHYVPTGNHHDETLDISPTGMRLCDQQRLEPLVLGRARELGAEVRFGTRFDGLVQDADGVTATLHETDGSGSWTVRCDYLLAADGIRSPVREALGIGRHGPGALGRSVSAIFDADLEPVLRGRRAMAVIVKKAGAFLFARGSSESRMWQLGFPLFEGIDPSEDGLRESTRALVRVAADDPGTEVTVHSAMAWESAALVADRFRSGRVFLVGDSAHAMPPAGGFGGNTGVQDGHNLAWKLAAVLAGAAGEALLDTYDAERRPVADYTVQETLARIGQSSSESRATVQLGYCYPSLLTAARECGGSDEPAGDAAVSEDPHRPSGRPGTRAPHVVLEHEGRRISALDLFGGGFVLLTAAPGGAWDVAAEPLDAREPAVAVRRIVGPEHRAAPGEGPVYVDVEGTFLSSYGIGAEGAVLVRPDGFIGWRTSEECSRARRRLSAAALGLIGHAASGTPR
ncbi:FAD-dependent monooxygenase [Streptomyces sp. NPDC087845]|uniref:FAD-dependent monooxygenase n=1 Tax=Streptomyces sp. NPDC087845 TaxID=3365806 RepID=UPI00382FDDA2